MEAVLLRNVIDGYALLLANYHHSLFTQVFKTYCINSTSGYLSDNHFISCVSLKPVFQSSMLFLFVCIYKSRAEYQFCGVTNSY